MEVRDSRRLTGPNILTDGPGAILDVAFEQGDDPADSVAAVVAWRRWLRRIRSHRWVLVAS